MKTTKIGKSAPGTKEKKGTAGEFQKRMGGGRFIRDKGKMAQKNEARQRSGCATRLGPRWRGRTGELAGEKKVATVTISLL